MRDHPVPDDDRVRAAALMCPGLPDASRDPDFDCMAVLACRTFGVPAAMILTIERGRPVVLAREGDLAREGEPSAGTDDEYPFCAYVIETGRPLVVEDASTDPRFAGMSFGAGPRVRFYAGVPLATEPGLFGGTLCIFDTKPRRLRPELEHILLAMAPVVAGMIRRKSDSALIAHMASDLRDSTDLIHEQAKALAHSRKIFERAAAEAKMGVWECDIAADRLTWTHGVYDIFELPRGSAIDRTQILDFYAEDSAKTLEKLRRKAIEECSGFNFDAEITTAKGNRRWMRLTVNVEAENGVATRIFGMKQDITAEKMLWEQTRFLAECDTLTGLANRSLFQARLGQTPTSAVEPTPIGALLLVDLDGFKQVNDTFGHALGDECLKQIAARLKHLCADADLVARIGGDEFAVLIKAGADPRLIEERAGQILDDLRRPIVWSEQSFQLGASIGIAIPKPAGTDNGSDLFREADLALYAAKSAGRNAFRVFTPDLKSKADRRSETVRTITRALGEDHLDLFYQPKLQLHDGRLSGFEALLRWRRSSGSIVAAGAFQAAFEDPKLSTRIGRWVITEALRQARAWHRANCDFGHISINLSSAQLGDDRFADILIEQIADHGLKPGMIEVEVTEAAFLGHDTGRITSVLNRLKTNGIRVALDDFGTGFASLAHLRTYPIDIVKVDKSFVRHCLTALHDRAILEAILGLGAKLGMDIVAEGIETLAQLECLKALGCRLGQGFLFAKAMPAAEAAAWHRSPPLVEPRRSSDRVAARARR